VAPQRHVDRDNGMRRISSTTRWLAGAGFVLVAAFSVYFSEQASSGNGSTSTVNTPVATAPPATDNGSGSVSTPQVVPTAPPITNPPRSHTRSGGS
jgi:hypothetical protein